MGGYVEPERLRSLEGWLAMPIATAAPSLPDYRAIPATRQQWRAWLLASTTLTPIGDEAGRFMFLPAPSSAMGGRV